jgi:hypothetical protein
VEAAKAKRKADLEPKRKEMRARMQRHMAKAQTDYPMLLEYGQKRVELGNEPETHASDSLTRARERQAEREAKWAEPDAKRRKT